MHLCNQPAAAAYTSEKAHKEMSPFNCAPWGAARHADWRGWPLWGPSAGPTRLPPGPKATSARKPLPAVSRRRAEAAPRAHRPRSCWGRPDWPARLTPDLWPRECGVAAAGPRLRAAASASAPSVWCAFGLRVAGSWKTKAAKLHTSEERTPKILLGINALQK